MKIPLWFPIVPILIALLFLSCKQDDENLGPEPDPLNISTPAELTAALDDVYNNANAPGFAVSVIKDDAVLYQEAFGKASIESNQDYTNKTIQPIGSVSKTFVAAAVVKAIDQGYFTLETDINDILPVEIQNPKQPDAVIRVKHLVTHTSGLLDNYEAYFQAYHILPGEDLSTSGAQLLLNIFGAQQRESNLLEDFLAEYYLEGGDLYHADNFAATAPGLVWNYSNIATSLTAYLVETATGVPFKEYVLTNVLQPLEMTDTAYGVADSIAANRASLYWNENTPLPLYGNDSYPDAGIYTTNEDLAKYLLDMMKGIKGESTALFSSAGYEMLFDALLTDGLVYPSLGENQGVFWFLKEGNINHSGSDPGTTCNLTFDETGTAGYFLMTNTDASTDEHQSAYLALQQKVEEAIFSFIENN